MAGYNDVASAAEESAAFQSGQLLTFWDQGAYPFLNTSLGTLPAPLASSPSIFVAPNTVPKPSSSISPWTDIAKGITNVLNAAFPVIWSFTGAGQAQAKATAAASQQATAVKAPAGTLTPANVQGYLLIAGVAVLGVVLALVIFKK